MTTCSKCSTQNFPGADYCARCGTKLGKQLSTKTIVFIVLGVVAVVVVLSSLHSDPPVNYSSNRPAASPTVDSMTAKQHLDRARQLVQNGHGTEALDDLQPILPSAPEYAEAQKLVTKARLLKEKEEAEANAREAKAAISLRQDYAREMETTMLEQYHDFYVRTSGSNQTTLTIRYILMSRPFVYNLTNDSAFMERLRKLGFKTVVFTDGYDETWTQKL